MLKEFTVYIWELQNGIGECFALIRMRSPKHGVLYDIVCLCSKAPDTPLTSVAQ
jgi:hypothetical protein